MPFGHWQFTEFRLAGYLISENGERTLNLADKMHAGMVGLNTGLVSDPAAPFGGVKTSGLRSFPRMRNAHVMHSGPACAFHSAQIDEVQALRRARTSSTAPISGA